MRLFNWSRNTLKAAYRDWQALEERNAAARRDLEQEYRALGREAEVARLEPDLGLLRAARLRLAAPPEAETLKAYNHLKTGFTILGRGRGAVPTSFQMDLSQYAARCEPCRRGYRELTARLRLARRLLELWRRDPEWGSGDFGRQAVISPEMATVRLRLSHRRNLGRRTRRDSLEHSWRLRINTGEKWLAWLKKFMVPAGYELCRSRLTAVVKEAGSPGEQDAGAWRAAHGKIDTLMTIANRQGVRAVAATAHPGDRGPAGEPG